MPVPRRPWLVLLFAWLALLPPELRSAPTHPEPAAQPPTPAILLIASRHLTHPGFRETVLLVTRHGRGGPLGVIVNRPLKLSLREVFPSLPANETRMLHEGGPVERGQISYLFRSPEPAPGTLLVAAQVHIGRSAALLSELLRGSRPHTGLRVVAGYAGWAPGQLESEIERGDWYVLPVDGNAIFDKPAETIWRDLHERATQTTARGRSDPAMLISAAHPSHSIHLP